MWGKIKRHVQNIIIKIVKVCFCILDISCCFYNQVTVNVSYPMTCYTHGILSEKLDLKKKNPIEQIALHIKKNRELCNSDLAQNDSLSELTP